MATRDSLFPPDCGVQSSSIEEIYTCFFSAWQQIEFLKSYKYIHDLPLTINTTPIFGWHKTHLTYTTLAQWIHPILQQPMVYRIFQISFEFNWSMMKYVDGFQLVLGHGHHWTDREWMCHLIAQEQQNSISQSLLFCLWCAQNSTYYTFSHIIDLHLIFFPHLPWSAVAVRCIFSGGHDVISLQKACLEPDTICTLMVVKQCLQMQSQIKLVTNIVVNTFVVDYNSAHKNPYP